MAELLVLVFFWITIKFPAVVLLILIKFDYTNAFGSLRLLAVLPCSVLPNWIELDFACEFSTN